MAFHVFDAYGSDALGAFSGFISNATSGDTILVRGMIPVTSRWDLPKPVHLVFGPGSGFILGPQPTACVYLRDAKPWVSERDVPFLPAATGESKIVVPFHRDVPVLAAVKPGTWLFLWARNELRGVMRHSPNVLQGPGESHRVAAIESRPDNATVIHLVEPLRDPFIELPAFSVRDTEMWEGLRVENCQLLGMANRVVSRGLVAQDIPGLQIDGLRTENAGDVAINCQRASVDISVAGQTKPTEHYGVVMGPPCCNFNVRVEGHKCRHVFDTSAGLPFSDGTHHFLVGHCNGTVNARVLGTNGTAPISTHANGNGITISGAATLNFDTVFTQPVQCALIRSRKTRIMNMHLDGGNQRESCGTYFSASGGRIKESSIANVPIAHIETGFAASEINGCRYHNVGRISNA